RFFAHACEQGPPGPVNVSPPDFLPLQEIARILGKRYLEVTAKQALSAIEFMWEHDLADITPGEAAGISYLPRMATDRLQNEWGFECAWSTAEAVLDLRRAIAGITSVAKRRVAIPWRLRFPTQRPGDVAADFETARPAAVAKPGELDTPVALAHPTYTRVTRSDEPLGALTLSTHAYLLRAAATGVLDAFGLPADEQRLLGGVGAGIFGHRLFVNDDVRAATAAAGRQPRILARAYGREVARLAAWASDTLARARDLATQSDAKLDATLSAVRDELAWFWAIATVGAALDGEPLSSLDGLITLLPGGVPLGVPAPTAGAHAAARAQAEHTAIALGQTLAAALRERARRLGTEIEHLTWDEVVSEPADVETVVKRRRTEHRRLRKLALPETLSAVGPRSAITIDGREAA
ncbi:MAG TPA: hypothetical protein VG410_07645, partial [Solirubrobacteraceae bacterium]|nr:hypothetical protein [Solirubrobacteraceae bacterium]